MLPNDMYIEILGHLPYSEIVRARRVCKLLLRLIESSLLLPESKKCLIQLYKKHRRIDDILAVKHFAQQLNPFLPCSLDHSNSCENMEDVVKSSEEYPILKQPCLVNNSGTAIVSRCGDLLHAVETQQPTIFTISFNDYHIQLNERPTTLFRFAAPLPICILPFTQIKLHMEPCPEKVITYNIFIRQMDKRRDLMTFTRLEYYSERLQLRLTSGSVYLI